MAPSLEAVRLARKLRDLRESQEPKLTQAQLARALSNETRVAVATISSWESLTNPKLPPEDRLRSYALFFAGSAVVDSTKRLPREGDLTALERERFMALHRELIGLRDAVRHQTETTTGTPYTFDFESGRMVVVCPELPEESRSPLADRNNPNHTRLYRYADLDALIELWGHIRASNPEHEVRHLLPDEVAPDDLSSHLILVGGVGLNRMTSRLLRVLDVLPIRQLSIKDVADGEVFRTRDGKEYLPVWEERAGTGRTPPSSAELVADQAQDAWRGGKPRELVEDVALLARLRNPFHHSSTITICNGVYSRGVLGAVRTLTDQKFRDRNEAFLADRFPNGQFGLLMRVPVVNGEAITPDFAFEDTLLFEWTPEESE